MLQEYNILRQEKEQEHLRLRVRECCSTKAAHSLWGKFAFLFLENFHCYTLSRLWHGPLTWCNLILQDQKKLQGSLIAEQEARSKPSPVKPQSVKKSPRISTGGASNKRVSAGRAIHQTLKFDSKTSTPQNSRPSSRKSDRGEQNEQLINHLNDCFTVLCTGTFLNTPSNTGET